MSIRILLLTILFLSNVYYTHTMRRNVIKRSPLATQYFKSKFSIPARTYFTRSGATKWFTPRKKALYVGAGITAGTAGAGAMKYYQMQKQRAENAKLQQLLEQQEELQLQHAKQQYDPEKREALGERLLLEISTTRNPRSQKTTDRIIKYLQDGANPNFQYKTFGGYIETPLLTAIKKDMPLVVRALILAGANLNTIDPKTGDSIIHEAIKRNPTPETLKEVVKFVNPDLLNRANDIGGTPLQQAVMDNHPTYIDLLIDAGANPNGIDPRYHSPLEIAIFKNNIGSVYHLISRGALVTQKNIEYAQDLQKTYGYTTRIVNKLKEAYQQQAEESKEIDEPSLPNWPQQFFQ